MITKYFAFPLIAVAAFVSCSDNDKTDETAQTYNNVVIDTTTYKKTGADSSLLNSMFQRSAGARNLTGLPENTTQNNGSALSGNNASRLNPAHGQPGHQCEIAVGAPLDSKPAAAGIPAQIQPIVTANPIAPITNASSVATNGSTGINPAHGQPNHRCDIAVGAPLNSKPTVNTATNTNIKPTAPTAVVAAPPVQNVAPGMNPAHGQPNHRCDIAVGEPLNSKPAATTINSIAADPVKADSAKN